MCFTNEFGVARNRVNRSKNLPSKYLPITLVSGKILLPQREILGSPVGGIWQDLAVNPFGIHG